MTIILRMSNADAGRGAGRGTGAAGRSSSAASVPRTVDTIPDVTPKIMNDTAEYCEELRGDIARIRATRGQIPPEAAMLSREGERMCKIGHIRPGIYRLRTALMILRNGS